MIVREAAGQHANRYHGWPFALSASDKETALLVEGSRFHKLLKNAAFR